MIGLRRVPFFFAVLFFGVDFRLGLRAAFFMAASSFSEG